MVQVPHIPDDVILEVQDLQTATVTPEGFVDRLQLFLLHGHEKNVLKGPSQEAKVKD